MKKSWTVIAIVLALLIGMICGGSIVGFAADSIFGDIDGDGKITAGDARLILRHVAKIETLKEPGKNPTTSGKVIFDSNSVKITYKSKTKDDFWDAQKINILIENNRSETINVMLDEVAVNGYMIDPFFASSVAANMKTNDNVMFFNSELSENGISTIKTLSFKIVILNNDFVTIVQSDTITLNV